MDDDQQVPRRRRVRGPGMPPGAPGSGSSTDWEVMPLPASRTRSFLHLRGLRHLDRLGRSGSERYQVTLCGVGIDEGDLARCPVPGRLPPHPRCPAGRPAGIRVGDPDTGHFRICDGVQAWPAGTLGLELDRSSPRRRCRRFCGAPGSGSPTPDGTRKIPGPSPDALFQPPWGPGRSQDDGLGVPADHFESARRITEPDCHLYLRVRRGGGLADGAAARGREVDRADAPGSGRSAAAGPRRVQRLVLRSNRPASVKDVTATPAAALDSTLRRAWEKTPAVDRGRIERVVEQPLRGAGVSNRQRGRSNGWRRAGVLDPRSASS